VAFFSAFGGPATDSCNWSVVQSGNNLSFTGSCNFADTVDLSGTIDTSTGAFTASGPATSSCRSLNISGAVSSDGSFMNGDDFFCTGREFGGTFTAEREFDISNNIIARYTHGPGIDEPLVIEKGGASFYYHADGLGSITEITDTDGTVIQSYTYSSFGEIKSQLDPNFVQPYTFTAREFDPETGLYHYRARSYDGTTSRFSQVDPIGLSGGINLYTYARDNPINIVDPFGLIGLKEVLQNPKVQAIGGAAIGFLLEKSSGKLCPGIGRGLVNLAGFAISARASASAVALSVGFGTVAVVSSPTVVGAVVNSAAALGFGALAIQQGVAANNFLQQAFEDFRSSGKDCDLVCSGASTN